ncbi:MAG: hypothetical protein IKD40_04340 [Bacteroidaceae bacterium]|nr:hypothetical protein [Bacteroidaceae bacterium]
MNKIYLEPIAKAHSLIEGVKNGTDLLIKKGIVIDVARLSSLCDSLETSGHLQDEAEESLRIAREKAHGDLQALKELYVDIKTSIKENYSQEMWQTFGVPDKK